MNESTRTIVLLCCTLSLSLTALPVGAAEPPAAAGSQAQASNPFTALLGEPKPPVPVPQEPAPVEPADLLLETVVLKFLDAKSVQSVLQKMVSDRGMVAINEKNNSVVICDDEANLARILAEIKKADVTPRQVMVEVVILDVKLGDDTEIGINWDLLSSDNYDVIYRQNFTTERLQSTPDTAETRGFATAFNTVGLGGDFSVVSGTVRHVLHMIQEKRDVEILASPRALVVSGKSATIKAVEEIPYQEVMDTATGGANALTSTEFKEVGVNLQVSATVTDDSNIFLEVDTQQNVRTGESDRGIPVVDTRQATTSLLLADGQTVIIGGLRREEKTVSTDQIPLLGDLPLVGWFFKSRRTIAAHSELVVLLSPHMYAGEPVPEHIAEKVDSLRRSSLLRKKETKEPAPDEKQGR